MQMHISSPSDTQHGGTALIEAARHDQHAVVKVLLEASADTEAMDKVLQCPQLSYSDTSTSASAWPRSMRLHFSRHFTLLTDRGNSVDVDSQVGSCLVPCRVA